jgi:hypothetical protein
VPQAREVVDAAVDVTTMLVADGLTDIGHENAGRIIGWVLVRTSVLPSIPLELVIREPVVKEEQPCSNT